MHTNMLLLSFVNCLKTINRGAPGNQITLVNQEYLEILNLECAAPTGLTDDAFIHQTPFKKRAV